MRITYLGHASFYVEGGGVRVAVDPWLTGNPKAEFAVRLNADCTVASVTLRQSSGHPDWDAAAERGIQRASPLPRQADGTCPSSLVILRGPRDN